MSSWKTRWGSIATSCEIWESEKIIAEEEKRMTVNSDTSDAFGWAIGQSKIQ